ncbi:hypothetical protein HMPREF1651_00035 [Prevotella bivia DNF00188]|nr:hypothetical protein HMPREF1651_00035 [Prevotella bivia DNF00188]KGF37783.1 hypothetical protein HMPREF2136_05310 [Prevotella bivia DNF00650]KXU59456.1 hypothetical protein HMPREF3218_0200570 [Prevotella bivia]
MIFFFILKKVDINYMIQMYKKHSICLFIAVKKIIKFHFSWHLGIYIHTNLVSLQPKIKVKYMSMWRKCYIL